MQYRHIRGTVQELFSPFASIAVWAAVRFVLKSSSSNSSVTSNLNRNLLNSNSENHSGHFYAFLPLITDPGDEARNRYYLFHHHYNDFFFKACFLVFQNIFFLKSAKQIEKVRILKDSLEFCHFISHRLFCPLSKSELKYTKRSTLEPQHPPMFACITRKADSSEKDLECHGFVCKSTEEAVSVAAHLYQSLVDTVKAQGNNKKVNDILVGPHSVEISQFSDFT